MITIKKNKRSKSHRKNRKRHSSPNTLGKMANLYFEAQLDAEQLKRELREINQRLSGFSDNVKNQGQEIDATFKRIGAAMAGYFSFTAAKGFLDQVVKVRGEFEMLEVAMTTMLGSKEKADALMSDVVEMAAKTPFSLTQIGEATKQLLAYQIPAEQIIDTLRSLGDIAAGLNVPVNQLVDVYGKVRAQGRLMGQELLQFMRAGIPMTAELAKHFNIAESEVSNLVSSGKVGFEDVKKVLEGLTSEGGMFFNLMEKESETLTGRISNLGDAWERMLNDIGQANEGTLKSTVDTLINIVENYEKIIDVLKIVIATYGAYRAALLAVVLAQKAQALMGTVQAWLSLAKGIKSAKEAQIAFNLASKANPWGLVAAGIAAMLTSLAVFNKKGKESAEILNSIGEAGKKLTEQRDLDALVDRYIKLSESVNRTAEEQAEMNKLVGELSTIIPLAINQWDNYGNAIGLSAQKIKEFNESSRLAALQEAERRLQEEKAALQSAVNRREELMRWQQLLSNAPAISMPGAVGEQARIKQSEYNKEIQETDKIIEELSKSIQSLSIEVGITTGQIPDYFRMYSSLLTDINGKTKDELLILQNSINGLLSTEIKDPRFEQQLNSQLKAISTALETIRNQEDEANRFTLENYRKHLSEQKKAYDEYNAAMRGAREKDREAIREYYKELINQGEDYQEFLANQLDAFKTNTEAKVAIYQAAVGAGIGLNTDAPTNIKGAGISKIEVKAPVIKSLEIPEHLITRWDKLRLKIQSALDVENVEKFAHGAVTIAYGMQDLAYSIGEVDSGMGDLLMSMADTVGMAGNLTKMAASGDMLGVAVGVVNSAVNSVTKIVLETKRRQQAEENFYRSINNLQNNYLFLLNEQLRLQSELKENVFSTDYQGRITDGIKAYDEAADKYRETMAEIEKLGRVRLDVKTSFSLGKLVEDTFSSGNIIESVGNAITSFFKGNKKKEVWGNLLESYKGLVDSAGNLNVELANAIIAEGILNDETEDLLKTAIAWTEQMEEAKKQIKGVISDLAGGLGDELRNALIDAFESGTDAALAFGNSVEKVLENVLSQMIFNQVFGSIFSQLEEDMAESFGAGGDMSWIDDFQRMFENVGAATEDFNKALQQAQEEAAKAGFKIFGGADDASLSGAIKGMSEQTASILAGQMNAIRINQAESLSLMIESIRYQAAIASNTSYNKHLASIDAKLDYLKSDPLKAKGL
jgi:hypothetical protein